MFKPGDKLLEGGRYEIIGQVGKGGMGIVYKALDINLDRLVAIKVLPTEVAEDRRFIRSLKHEAKLAAGLRHENVVMVYDAPEWEQNHFIIMEFVEGRTLEDIVVDDFPLSVDQFLDIMIQTCTGLQYIHDHQILHRDIKPKNIMMTERGVVKITDFGIAHIVKQTVARLTGKTTGTMPYMSPEQITARPSDHRSDIYSLGVTMYEILTNDLPFPGPDFAFQHLQVEVPSPSERLPDSGIPTSVSVIVMRCLKKDPADRYGAMSEITKDLDAVKRGVPIADQTERLKALEAEAQAESAARNFRRVIEICEQILKLDPDNAAAKEGIELARKALDTEAKEIDDLLRKAQQDEEAGNFQEAIQTYRKILDRVPAHKAAEAGLKKAEKRLNEQRQDEKDKLIRQAREAERKDDYEEAIRLWKSVLRIDSGNKAARTGLEDAEKAVNDRRKEIDRLSRQAQQEEHDGRLEDAIRTWDRVLKLEPGNDTAQTSKSVAEDILRREKQRIEDEKNREKQRIENEKRRQKEEEERQQLAVQQAQRRIQTLVLQAQEEERAGNAEGALELWQQVLDIAPDHQIAQAGKKRNQELMMNRRFKKIEYAVAAASIFIRNLHRNNFDHGMIATFGNTFRVEQNFTSNENNLQYSLGRVVSSITNERTRLYDSIEDVITEFWRNGARDRPWLLTIITDGQDNESRKYRSTDRNSPVRIGDYVLRRFNHEPTNFPFLIGVGDGQQIDAQSLAIIGQVGRFPAVTIAAFPLLEQMFLRIALQVSSQLVGRTFDFAGLTWAQVQEIRKLVQVPIDYAFLIDRSGSMNELG